MKKINIWKPYWKCSQVDQTIKKKINRKILSQKFFVYIYITVNVVLFPRPYSLFDYFLLKYFQILAKKKKKWKTPSISETDLLWKKNSRNHIYFSNIFVRRPNFANSVKKTRSNEVILEMIFYFHRWKEHEMSIPAAYNFKWCKK